MLKSKHWFKHLVLFISKYINNNKLMSFSAEMSQRSYRLCSVTSEITMWRPNVSLWFFYPFPAKKEWKFLSPTLSHSVNVIFRSNVAALEPIVLCDLRNHPLKAQCQSWIFWPPPGQKGMKISKSNFVALWKCHFRVKCHGDRTYCALWP